ncbi:threonine--tRNA ligase [Syntrophobacter fumaroxidans]|uniref:Threonine--tRNA ligase n=1 Tax=Syntrophobacter fumaroxidans (strain DSM 10017 / MPOB) TaxID=335543 RepID=A0LFC2_SYNFM|nr:threonine--tRNA ligase [Syntrophobacter fumaroxidans]ABK16124.1 threonyl-tRNA synthetase [Syntrophobacter fumaroxidans MPOB]
MSAEISVTLADGTTKSFPRGVSAGEVLKASGGPNGWVAAKVNGVPVDLIVGIEEDAAVEGIRADSEVGLEILRHSAAHVMAQAVKSLFPEARVAIGPAIDNGFYYDFEVERPFTQDDLDRIEAKMKELVGAKLKFERKVLPRDEAIDFFTRRGEGYKVELLQGFSDPTVSFYTQGDFVDLCRGPHVPHSGYVRAFKLTSVAGAYWRGDEHNAMLQRIYGTAFADRDALKKYLHFLEEAQKRDHRRLGRELDLFSFSDEVGAGMVIYHPRGALLRHILEAFEKREHLRRGYHIVMGPTLLKTELWKRSGHFEHYRENMYFTEIEEQSYGIKPMNCLAHMLIYKSRLRSYRDLPLRYFELGTVHRHERSGVLHGLTRVRQFTQDDAHILCTPEQLHGEIQSIIDFVIEVMGIFGFNHEMEISTRPAKSIGSDEDWERATSALIDALEDKGIPYQVCEGEGAFYGPKIDVKLRDALDRKWQCATIQCDFTLPDRFDLTYVGVDGNRHRPVMVHRVVLGSLERFIGVLVEHFAGAFPTWLAPVQAIVVTVTDGQIEFARNMYDRLREAGVRVELDDRNEKLGYKIREAQMQKVPYMLVIGDREVAAGGVAPRRRDGTQLELIAPEAFAAMIQKECLEATKGRVGLGIV